MMNRGELDLSILDNVAQYVIPQACGNHTGVRFATGTNELGQELRID